MPSLTVDVSECCAWCEGNPEVAILCGQVGEWLRAVRHLRLAVGKDSCQQSGGSDRVDLLGFSQEAGGVFRGGLAVGLGRIPPESTAAMGQENLGMVGFRSFFAGPGNGNPGGWRPSHACLAVVGGSAEVVQSAVERCEVLLVVDKRCKR